MAKSCVRKSGKHKGKLKPGWRFGKGGRCVKAKKTATKKRRRKRRR